MPTTSLSARLRQRRREALMLELKRLDAIVIQKMEDSVVNLAEAGVAQRQRNSIARKIARLL